jgi:hypothetical protein
MPLETLLHYLALQNGAANINFAQLDLHAFFQKWQIV